MEIWSVHVVQIYFGWSWIVIDQWIEADAVWWAADTALISARKTLWSLSSIWMVSRSVDFRLVARDRWNNSLSEKEESGVAIGSLFRKLVDVPPLLVMCPPSFGKRAPAKNQGPTTKHYTIKVLKHTHTPNHMINIEITHIVVLNERISTLQKWSKSVGGALSYWGAK